MSLPLSIAFDIFVPFVLASINRQIMGHQTNPISIYKHMGGLDLLLSSCILFSVFDSHSSKFIQIDIS